MLVSDCVGRGLQWFAGAQPRHSTVHLFVTSSCHEGGNMRTYERFKAGILKLFATSINSIVFGY